MKYAILLLLYKVYRGKNTILGNVNVYGKVLDRVFHFLVNERKL